MDRPIPFPQHIDSPRPFLVWTTDEMVPLVLLISIGIFIDRFFTFLLLGFVAITVWRRLRDRMPDGFILHYLYFRIGVPFKGRTFVNPFDSEIRSR